MINQLSIMQASTLEVEFLKINQLFTARAADDDLVDDSDKDDLEEAGLHIEGEDDLDAELDEPEDDAEKDEN